MKLKKRTRQGRGTVTLSGALTVADAVRLAGSLREILAKAGSITLTFRDVDSVDLSLVQVVCSAHKAAQASDREMTLAFSTGSELVKKAVTAAGMTDHLRCTLADSCIWSTEAVKDVGGRE